MFEAMGIPADDALTMASASDDVMGQCILDLYRSATPNPHADWGPYSKTTAPGLIIRPTEDPFDDAARGSEVAAMLGAREATIAAGHFWPYQAPDDAARVLTEFWDSLA
jgi:hypothetical protein